MFPLNSRTCFAELNTWSTGRSYRLVILSFENGIANFFPPSSVLTQPEVKTTIAAITHKADILSFIGNYIGVITPRGVKPFPWFLCFGDPFVRFI